MPNCYFCYRPAEAGKSYHSKCCKKLFGTNELPELKLDPKLLKELANETVNKRIAITGVQPKLSLELEEVSGNSRLTIVGLWGKFILKPQTVKLLQMPEVEDLTMHLATLFKIKTCEHCLIPTSEGGLAYIAKRFDRVGKQKIHMEDFCQLGGFMTEQKYDSSYERCGKLISKYCSNSGLDILSYFELLIFSFLSGNSDMHMKNFSILHKDGEISLSPAYDLINSHVVYTNDEEDMALWLSGKKTEIKYREFENLAASLGIAPKVFSRIIKKFTQNPLKVFELIDQSFLSEDHKTRYKTIWNERLKRLV